MANLKKIVAALIDTAKRTTDLDNVYNDSNDDSYTWKEVDSAYDSIRDKPCPTNKVYRVGLTMRVFGTAYITAKDEAEAAYKAMKGEYKEFKLDPGEEVDTVDFTREV